MQYAGEGPNEEGGWKGGGWRLGEADLSQSERNVQPTQEANEASRQPSNGIQMTAQFFSGMYSLGDAPVRSTSAPPKLDSSTLFAYHV